MITSLILFVLLMLALCYIIELRRKIRNNVTAEVDEELEGMRVVEESALYDSIDHFNNELARYRCLLGNARSQIVKLKKKIEKLENQNKNGN